ncbi:MAG: hypothetical protein A2V90_01390 [Gammaproteobacteria bacterium RBG_16_57_12]|nr:MAG: hypothetical protein A2V90_01390 [Gammaproteobacteria bacterium RBG_16_57_12]
MQEGQFDMTGGPRGSANIWNLNHPVDGAMNGLSVEIISPHKASLEINYRSGDFDLGTLTDTDYDAAGVISHLSYSTSRGDSSQWEINYFMRLRGEEAEDSFIDLGVGYLSIENQAGYYDPLIVVDWYTPMAISWAENWNNYTLKYRGLRLGLRGNVPVEQGLAFNWAVGFIPSLEADYTGLRYPERPPADQRPEKIIADGRAYDGDMSLRFTPRPHLAIAAGYKYLNLETDGEDVGTAWAGSWEQLDTVMKGPYLKLDYLFN